MTVIRHRCQSIGTEFRQDQCKYQETKTGRDSSYKSLRATVNEFNFLVSSFCRYLVDPVYEQVPTRLTPEVLARYTPQVEGELIQYRERFVSFKDSYSDFLRELEERLPRPLGLGCYIQGPKPLKGLPGGKTIAQL